MPTPLLPAESWLRLPGPDLAGLEPAVRSQLAALRKVTEERIAAEGGTPEDLAEAVGDLGRHYHAYDLVAAAESCYRIARRLAPQDFRWPYFLGYLLQSAGRLEEAEIEYLRALGIYRRVPPALVRLGQVYRDLEQPEAAEQVLREALSLDSASSAAQAALGELYESLGRYDEAIPLLEAALEATPEATRLYYPLAMAHRGRGDAERARELLARRGPVGIRPADPLIDGLAELQTGERVFLLAGQQAFRAGRYEEAVAAFRKAVEAAPDSVTARIDLGSALGQLGDSNAALAEFDKALELAPENPTALFNAGVLRKLRGDLEGALEHLKLAARIEPDDAAVRVQLAEASRLSGKLEDALLHFRAASAIHAKSEAARLGEAQVLLSLGRPAESRTGLEAALEELPSSGLLAGALARLLAMGPVPDLRDGERALGLAERVFAARPTAAHAEVVAAALAELGRCDEAAKWQRQTLSAAGSEEPGRTDDTRRAVLARYEAGPPCRYPVGQR